MRGAAKPPLDRHLLKGLWGSEELPIYLKTVGTGMQVELRAATRIPVGGPPPRGRQSTQMSTSRRREPASVAARSQLSQRTLVRMHSSKADNAASWSSFSS